VKKDFDFGKLLRELRKTDDLSQSVLATKLSTSQDTISLWERNISLPDFDSIKLLAKTFSVSADYLLGLKEYE